LISIGVALFQAWWLMIIILGFFISKYLVRAFFHPITLAVFAATEFCVLCYSGHIYQREERNLLQDLIALFHPWRMEYGITAKIRKMHGQIAIERGAREVAATYYCLVLERATSDDDIDTVSLSTQTDLDIDSEV
jgi:hypothetical protein